MICEEVDVKDRSCNCQHTCVINSMNVVGYVAYDNYISMSMDVWNDLVKRCDSVDRYKHIVNEMFSHGIINEGRLIILDLYTHCVCEKFPNNSETISSCHSDSVTCTHYSFY